MITKRHTCKLHRVPVSLGHHTICTLCLLYKMSCNIWRDEKGNLSVYEVNPFWFCKTKSILKVLKFWWTLIKTPTWSYDKYENYKIVMPHCLRACGLVFCRNWETVLLILVIIIAFSHNKLLWNIGLHIHNT